MTTESKSTKIDHAHVVLEHAPLTQDQKADLWDEVYRAPNADALAHSLESFDLPAHLVAALITAKRLIDSESRADKTKDAAERMAELDPKTLDLLESHPRMLQHFTKE